MYHCWSVLLQVYLSTYSSTVMAGLIQGPCEVHAPRNFTEESERRVRLAKGSDNLSRPLYLCKYVEHLAFALLLVMINS